MFLSAGVRLAGPTLTLAGAAVLTAALVGYSEGSAWQRSHSSGESSPPGRAGSFSIRPGEPLARLRIPKIDLDLTVIEGTRKVDLLKAPGHVLGSAVPGASANCIIAGHRDLHFRRIGRLSPGDLIELESGGKRLEYRVEERRIVTSSDTGVLAAGKVPILTLLTCYPFHYVGPAPQRYVVRARLEPSAPASS